MSSTSSATHEVYSCAIAVVGGGLGGVAAALAACDAGHSVVLSEPTAWLGGQMTSQGTSALDEHQYIERFGGTRSYYAMRQAIRDWYSERYGVAAMPGGAPLNPGNGWVSQLCFEPRVGAEVLNAMLAPHVASGRLTILHGFEPVSARVDGARVVSVTLRRCDPSQPPLVITLQARYFLDATELGDLLPLTGAEYVIGAEARGDTGEELAPEEACPERIQSFTFPFAVEYRPGEDHTIPKPPGYSALRESQPYTLTLPGRNGPPRAFRMFEPGPVGLPFWSYRRIRDGVLLDPGGGTSDIAMINWPSNDYRAAAIVDVTAEQRAAALDQARRLSLGFLYWLQTEAPRDDGRGAGYPELRLAREVMGTADGLSMAPYIRESRRIVARRRIVAHELLASHCDGPRAQPYNDSIGIGWYFMDVHPAVGYDVDRYLPTRPFQIPLGALVPVRMENLLPACKNIGTTHLSNGSYRLHPVEWAIGEAAGALAAFCCDHALAPQAICEMPRSMRALQSRLLTRGMPLAWAVDVPLEHPAFIMTQQALVAGALIEASPRAAQLAIAPETPVSCAEASAFIAALTDWYEGMERVRSAIPSRWQAEPDSPTRRDEWLRVLDDQAPKDQHPPSWSTVCRLWEARATRRTTDAKD